MPIESIYTDNDIWACGCGGKTWHLLMDGRVECRSCGFISDEAQWKYIEARDNKETNEKVHNAL